jgi:membrane-bound inhibitor of C-type lysozyme
MAKKSTKKVTVKKLSKSSAESKTNKKLILTAIILLIAAVAFLYFYKANVQRVAAPVDVSPTPADISVTFKCPNGYEIPATFNNSAGTVTFMLPGQEEMTLPHAISADGAKYANADESMVFWNVGNSVMIMENGVTTYENCVSN